MEENADEMRLLQMYLPDLHSPDVRKRSKAVIQIGHNYGAIAEIVHLSREDPSDHVRLMAAVCLNEEQMDAIVECTNDSSEKIVWTACRKIGIWGDHSHIPLLELLVPDDRWHVSFDACLALFRITEDTKWLIKCYDILKFKDVPILYDLLPEIGNNPTATT